MSTYAIMMQGSCAICRRMREIDSIWDSHEEVIDATGHDLWEEYETLLDSLWCISHGMENL